MPVDSLKPVADVVKRLSRDTEESLSRVREAMNPLHNLQKEVADTVAKIRAVPPALLYPGFG